MRVSTLCFVLGFLLSPVGGLLAEEPPKADEPTKVDESAKEVFTFELGHAPTGNAVDLPAWALGNLTVRGFSSGRMILDVTVNILPQLLPGSSETYYSIQPGQLVAIPLKSGDSLVFYFKVKPITVEVKEEMKEEQGEDKFITRIIDTYNVTLIVRKMPAAKP